MGITFFHFVTIHAFDRQTDGRMDKQTDSFLVARSHWVQCMQRGKIDKDNNADRLTRAKTSIVLLISDAPPPDRLL